MKILLSKEESNKLIQEIRSIPWMIGKDSPTDYRIIKSLEFITNHDGVEIMLLSGDHNNVYGETMSGTHYIYKKMTTYKVLYDWYTKESRSKKINDLGL